MPTRHPFQVGYFLANIKGEPRAAAHWLQHLVRRIPFCRQPDEAKVHEILSAYFLDQISVHAKVGGRRVSFIPSEQEVIREIYEATK